MSLPESEPAVANPHTERLPARSALLSLSDRTGSEVLAHALSSRGATLYATSGTAAYLRNLGFPVEPAERLSGTAEFLGGRVKTLSPGLFGAILARPDESDRAALAERGLTPLDLVAVTLYPFESVPEDASWEETVEQIDVGGVALLRAAAKNFERVAVLADPAQYPEAAASLERGGTTREERRRWARAAFERTAEYDAAIARRFRRDDDDALPEVWIESYRRSRGLRYGENPHQEGALYESGREAGWWEGGAVLEGKELSYNNLLDLEAALELAYEFVPPACVVVKHNEPCGVGLGESPAEAFRRALAGDPVSAYGGVVAFNRELDEEASRELAAVFLECVAAPEIGDGARAGLAGKRNLRAVRVPAERFAAETWRARPVRGGLLVQRVRPEAGEIQLQVVTHRAPSPAEMEALHFAWTVTAHARSNAVVVAVAEASLGIGSGQTSRIDSLNVALHKLRRSGLDSRGAVLASDGFFPFADWVPLAQEAGLTACIQPGGSIRDAESIEACDAAGIAMVFTARRQFRH